MTSSEDIDQEQMTSIENIDLFSDGVLHDPYPAYRALRDGGSAVYLAECQAWAISRYDDVRSCLRNADAFQSGAGVGLNDDVNRLTAGSVLTSDGDLHARLRRVLSRYLSPPSLRELQGKIEARADELVGTLVVQGSFDAVTDLAAPFPVMVVSDLVGLPPVGRERLLAFADGFFNMLGPGNERTWMGATIAAGIVEFLTTEAGREQLAPGGWGMAIYEAADAGEIEADSVIPLMAAYITAAMDTTVNSIGSAVMLFSAHEDQWKLVREDPTLLPQAFDEVLRVESPVQVFARTVATPSAFGETTIPVGDRVLMLYGSANRDERRWSDPEEFDVRRDAGAHLAFGYGVHRCAGQGLALIEAHSILAALARHAHSFQIDGEVVRHLNNSVRGLEHLPVAVVAER